MKSGWSTDSLGNICDFLNRGISPKYLAQDGVCVLNQKCIRDHRVNYELARRHDADAKAVSIERTIQLGDVLVNSTGTGTLGRVAQVREQPVELTTVDSHVTIVRPKHGRFFLDFFGYMLVLIEEAIEEAGEGCGGQTELSRSVLAEKFLVSYPVSISEQQRIVAILDEAFEQIAIARTNTEKNLQNARALFESYLHSIDAEEQEFGNFVSIKTGKLDANAAVEGGAYPFFTCSRDVYRIDKFAFDCEAILLAGNNASGDFNVKHYIGKFNAYQRTYVITVNNESDASYRYLYFQLLAKLKDFKKQSVGSNTKFLKIGMIQGMKIPMPSFAEQQAIVIKLDGLLAETQHLESIYQRKLTALDALKKSLLHKAFAGEL